MHPGVANRLGFWIGHISGRSFKYVIVDIEFPRLGLIRVDAADQVLRDLRKSMQ